MKEKKKKKRRNEWVSKLIAWFQPVTLLPRQTIFYEHFLMFFIAATIDIMITSSDSLVLFLSFSTSFIHSFFFFSFSLSFFLLLYLCAYAVGFVARGAGRGLDGITQLRQLVLDLGQLLYLLVVDFSLLARQVLEPQMLRK